ncbi:hypothetical protein Tco_0762906 [Tanacetum coccineum]
MSHQAHFPATQAISPILCTESTELLILQWTPSQDPYVAPLLVVEQGNSTPTSSEFSNALPVTARRPGFVNVHSSGLDASDQAHSGSSTRDVSPRLCYPPRRAPRGDFIGETLSAFIFHVLLEHLARDLEPTVGFLYPSSTPRVDNGVGYLVRYDVKNIEIDPEGCLDDSIGVMWPDNQCWRHIVEEEIVKPAGEDSFDSSGTRDGIVRSFEDIPINLDDVVRDFYHHISEVRIDRFVGIETTQRRLEADQLIAMRQRVSMIERIDSL